MVDSRSIGSKNTISSSPPVSHDASSPESVTENGSLQRRFPSWLAEMANGVMRNFDVERGMTPTTDADADDDESDDEEGSTMLDLLWEAQVS